MPLKLGRHFAAVFGLTLMFAPVAEAGIIGYCLTDGGGLCAAPDATFTANITSAIAAAGYTALALSDLGSTDLLGITVLWVLNQQNGSPGDVVLNNLSNVSNFVTGGGILSFHDRNVNQAFSATLYLPGGAGIIFVSEFGSDINVVTGSTLVTNGPGGVIDNSTLDGGTYSFHGYATLASLPAGAIPILSTADPGQIVDFFYRFGLGGVYYSSIPLDFYLSGFGPNPPADAFRTVYAPNEAAFQAALVIPEPASFVLMGLGLLGLGALRGRSRIK
jgi:hypothetical protein